MFNPNNTTNDCVNAYTMVTTVATQKKLFSRREIAAADEARALYRKIGRPDEAEFQRILRSNVIQNCPVTPDDARRAHIIYGPDIAVIKGKTTRSDAAPRAPTFVAEPIPAPILKHHRNVTLCADFFFVQGLPFYHTISRDIGFRTVSHVSDRTKSTILRETQSAIRLYHTRGLKVCDVHADNEFDCIREELWPIALNVVPADSHVGDIERSIRTIKERLRSCAHGLPFKRLPKLMITQMVADAVRCLNQFPRKNGISDTLSPTNIVTGLPNPDYNRMRIEFGTYVQVFEDNDPSNTLRARSLGAIALCPTGNFQGDYYFMSLATGSKISRHQWTPLPMTDTAIARVEAIALNEGQPPLQQQGLVVEWRPDHHIDDSEYDRDFDPPNEPTDVFDADGFDPIGNTEVDDLLADGPHPYFDPPAAPAGALAQGAIIAHEPPQAPEPELDADEPDEDELNNNENEEPEEENEEPEEPEENELNNNENERADSDEEEDNDDETQNEEDEVEPLEHQGAPGAHRPYNLRQRERRTTNQLFKEAVDKPHSSKSYLPPRQET